MHYVCTLNDYELMATYTVARAEMERRKMPFPNVPLTLDFADGDVLQAGMLEKVEKLITRMTPVQLGIVKRAIETMEKNHGL